MLDCNVSNTRGCYGFEHGLQCLKMSDVCMVMFCNGNDTWTMEQCNELVLLTMMQGGRTALMHAARTPGGGDVVKILISKGAEINAKDEVCCFQNCCVSVALFVGTCDNCIGLHGNSLFLLVFIL